MIFCQFSREILINVKGTRGVGEASQDRCITSSRVHRRPQHRATQ